jgi:hypothetical protein
LSRRTVKYTLTSFSFLCWGKRRIMVSNLLIRIRQMMIRVMIEEALIEMLSFFSLRSDWEDFNKILLSKRQQMKSQSHRMNMEITFQMEVIKTPSLKNPVKIKEVQQLSKISNSCTHMSISQKIFKTICFTRKDSRCQWREMF